jgi:hypothetical protein
MTQKFRLLAALTVFGIAAACATKPKGEATSTVEEVPNEPGAEGTAAPAAAETQLVELAPPEGFKVQMPPSPKESREKKATAAGEVSVGSWFSQTPDQVTFSVSTADYPETVIASISPANFLNSVRDGVVKQVQGTVKSQEDITLDGYPGKAYVVESPQGEVKVRNYLVGPRLYTLLVVYNPSIGAPQADTFLNSLALVNPPPAIPFRGKGSADGGVSDGGAMMDADAGTMAADAGTPAAPKKKRSR